MGCMGVFITRTCFRDDCIGAITYSVVNRGIKHDFPFINIRKVPREVLKTEGVARGFQHSRGTLRMLINVKSCLIAIIA